VRSRSNLINYNSALIVSSTSFSREKSKETLALHGIHIPNFSGCGPWPTPPVIVTAYLLMSGSVLLLFSVLIYNLY
jgi:hypothetical protein